MNTTILHSAFCIGFFAMFSLRDALESALVENPDDLATHHAYADYLQEQGDPRGEFIQLQLALEDPRRPARERQALETRVQELLIEHEREWLGILADELLDGYADPAWVGLWTSQPPYEHSFARGWLDRIVLHDILDPPRPTDLAPLLCRAPQARLVRELILEFVEGTIEPLVSSPYLLNLRVFQLGKPMRGFDIRDWRSREAPMLPELIAKLPRIEELRLLAHGYDAARLFALPNLSALRVLQVDYSAERYPLEVLATNPALGNLTHLLVCGHPIGEPPRTDLAGARAVVHSPQLPKLTHLQLQGSDHGDVGCTEIVTSGILKRLKVLDLRHGEITDSGARTLADCPDLRRLELLDIERNALTQTGIDALRRILGSALRADIQQTPEELAQRRYLYDEPFA
jgi:uncharacterized protein (TIGR02996 family)